MSMSILDGARASFEQGRFDLALGALRGLNVAALDAAGQVEAWRLRCLSAYKVGELAESADAAGALIALIEPSADHTSRFDVLNTGVVAAAQLARYGESIEHLRRLLSLAARQGNFAAYVRARGSAATCFALMGDLWAGRRVLAELVGQFQGLPDQIRLEATARNNHTAVCLQLGRLAEAGADPQAAAEARDHARVSLARMGEIAHSLGDARVLAFVRVHESELNIQLGDHRAAIGLLEPALEEADRTGLWAHSRQMRLLAAEALLGVGDFASAFERLRAVQQGIGDGHEIEARVRLSRLTGQALAAAGEHAAALAELALAQALGRFRRYRQFEAQSQFLRTRLELEHLYRYRAETRL